MGETTPADIDIRLDSHGKVQQRPKPVHSWTKAMRVRFLDHLAATCNVRMAAEAIGKPGRAAQALRRTDADFAEAWEKALETGYATLEAMLIARASGAEAASRSYPAGETEDVPDADQLDSELAIRLLGHYRARVKNPSRHGRKPHKKATEKETDAIIIKRLKALNRRLAREEKRDAAG